MRLSFRVNLVANAPKCENRGEAPFLQLVFGDDQRLFDIHTLDQYLTLDTRGEGRALCARTKLIRKKLSSSLYGGHLAECSFLIGANDSVSETLCLGRTGRLVVVV